MFVKGNHERHEISCMSSIPVTPRQASTNSDLLISCQSNRNKAAQSYFPIKEKNLY